MQDQRSLGFGIDGSIFALVAQVMGRHQDSRLSEASELLREGGTGTRHHDIGCAEQLRHMLKNEGHAVKIGVLRRFGLGGIIIAFARYQIDLHASSQQVISSTQHRVIDNSRTKTTTGSDN